MSYEMLEHGSKFRSEQCPEGIVAIAGNTLRILTVEDVSNEFNTTSVPLSFTPRKMVLEPVSRQFVIIESDHRTVPYLNATEDVPLEQFGHHRADATQWSSMIRIVNPFQADTVQSIMLDNNEAAFRFVALFCHQ
jgi:splicing factor 3B subunit 3